MLILVFGPLSGAHFNPVVSASFALQRGLPWNECTAYVPVQIAGAIIGTLLAHLMFGEPLIQASTHIRTGLGIWIGEIVATFALLLTIVGWLRADPKAAPYAVGLVITAGYCFTSSTSFANPAVTIAHDHRPMALEHAGPRGADRSARGGSLAARAGALGCR